MKGTFMCGSYSCVEGTFTCGSYSCVEGAFICGFTHLLKEHSNVGVTHMWKGHPHVGLTDMWELLLCGRDIHMWDLLTCGSYCCVEGTFTLLTRVTSHQSEIRHSLIFLTCIHDCQKDTKNKTFITDNIMPTGERRLKSVIFHAHTLDSNKAFEAVLFHVSYCQYSQKEMVHVVRNNYGFQFRKHISVYSIFYPGLLGEKS